MASSTKYCIGIALLLAACNEPAFQPVTHCNNVGQNENKLVGDWEYLSIQIRGETFYAADERLEFVGLNSERDILSRRWINYSCEQVYQLRWNRSTYHLGTEGDDNWQPDYGYWSINVEGDSLFHNKGMRYEAAYKIGIVNGVLTRTSTRQMSKGYKNLWEAGDPVTFTERFKRH